MYAWKESLYLKDLKNTKNSISIKMDLGTFKIGG